MSLPAEVLANYPPAFHGAITPLGNHGGFSGAQLYHIGAPAGAFCLRAWPPSTDDWQVRSAHNLMEWAAGKGIEFVPRPMLTMRGEQRVRAARRWWEVTTWMSGTASFWHDPSLPRLRAACVALARLHAAWDHPEWSREPCDAVQRRLAVVHDWLPRMSAGWRPPSDPRDPVTPWALRAWAHLREQLPRLSGMLDGWRTQSVHIQPCLCDIWHDHVLFIGDRVTGIVDFGSNRMDSVAADLARLLGSLVGDDRAMWAAGLDAYAQQRPLRIEERALAHVLDRSGIVAAAANWLRWLYCERRGYPDREAVARRLAGIVERLEKG
jgi:Ser/Thr protein kinase RdoA (MazF antagonist)